MPGRLRLVAAIAIFSLVPNSACSLEKFIATDEVIAQKSHSDDGQQPTPYYESVALMRTIFKLKLTVLQLNSIRKKKCLQPALYLTKVLVLLLASKL